MDSIVNRLTEIEEAAEAIVRHAEKEKELLDREYEEKKQAFDREQDEKTQASIAKIRGELEDSINKLKPRGENVEDSSIEALKKEYETKHSEYARAILRRITEV